MTTTDLTLDEILAPEKRALLAELTQEAHRLAPRLADWARRARALDRSIVLPEDAHGVSADVRRRSGVEAFDDAWLLLASLASRSAGELADASWLATTFPDYTELVANDAARVRS
jgi:hypothetical protein